MVMNGIYPQFQLVLYTSSNNLIYSSSKKQWVIPYIKPSISSQLSFMLVAEFGSIIPQAKKFTISTYHGI